MRSVEMNHRILSLHFGINHCYIVETDRGAIMVDAGPPNIEKSFLKQLKKHSVDPQEIRLIVLTHGDFDHAGSAKTIKKLTGAKIAIQNNDRKLLEEGIFNWPPGTTKWGKISHGLFYPVVKNRIKMDTVNADILLDDQDLSLNDYGIQGKIIHTPGHTSGSVSVLLDTGDAFTGCLSHNRLPFTLKPQLPIYAEDIEMIRKSWKKIIGMGAKISYPGHGKPFEIERIMRYL
jgi:glyoxylase-like metal-dependent hydrolase (beta-lactamase superfamily II)